jgi:diacylglycerol kinase (ATP)
MRIRKVGVVINPSAGRNLPVLGIITELLNEADIEWDVRVTRASGDAARLAREFADKGVDAVAVCGGDGTVGDAASGLIGGNTPLAIIPGGTGNNFAIELGIPSDIIQACRMLGGDDLKIRACDMGSFENTYFILRLSLGLEAEIVKGAEKDSKRKVGGIAYVTSYLRTIFSSRPSRYTLDLDGKRHEVDGVSCIVANSGNLGVPWAHLAPDIHVDDGVFDVVVLRPGGSGRLYLMRPFIVGEEAQTEAYYRWRAREVRVDADPPQNIQCDGEIFSPRTMHTSVIPAAVKMVVPTIPVQ